MRTGEDEKPMEVDGGRRGNTDLLANFPLGFLQS